MIATQPSLFDALQRRKPRCFSETVTLQNQREERPFEGETFDLKRDGARLNRQLQRVFDLMKDGKWRTLDEISVALRAPMQSVSARLRDLRKPKWGAHTVERRSLGKGLFAYRLIVSIVDQPSGAV